MLCWCKPLMPPRLCAGCAAEAMKVDPDCAVPPCVMLWLRLLGSSGKRGEQDVTDLLQCAKRALDVRPHTLREHAVRPEPSLNPKTFALYYFYLRTFVRACTMCVLACNTSNVPGVCCRYVCGSKET